MKSSSQETQASEIIPVLTGSLFAPVQNIPTKYNKPRV